MIPFILSGCFKDKEAGYMKNFANGSGFKNLADASVLFSNSKITGWDRSGPLYFVADCNNIDDDIKFVNTTSKDRTFIDGKNEDFERSVDDFINEKFSDVYIHYSQRYFKCRDSVGERHFAGIESITCIGCRRYDGCTSHVKPRDVIRI